MPKDKKNDFSFLKPKENEIENIGHITEEINQPEEKVERPFAKKETKNKRIGKVMNIVPGVKAIVEYEGNGEMLPYNESEHKNLKKGDPIEL